jgi:predicted amino acid dehydrogenase
LQNFALLVQPDFSAGSSRLKTPILARIPAFIGGRLEGLNTALGSGETGWLICQPRLSKTDYPAESLARINRQRARQLTDLTQKLGINILGVGEADYGDWRELLKARTSLTLSEGTAYRAGLVRQLLVELLSQKGLPFSQVRVVVTGAGVPLGKICARVLATQIRKLSLAGITERDFDFLARQILYESGTSVRLARELNREFSETDVLVAADEEPGGGESREWQHLKTGALVLLVSSQWTNKLRNLPQQVEINQLMVSLPWQIRFKSSLLYKAYQGMLQETWPEWLSKLNQPETSGAGRQLVPASLAEVILLASDHSISGFSPGNDTGLKLVDQMVSAGKKLKFIPQLSKISGAGPG